MISYASAIKSTSQVLLLCLIIIVVSFFCTVLQVGVIEDILFGTRFSLSDGSIRGRFCPGGIAGPFLRVRRLLLSIRTRLRLLGQATEPRHHHRRRLSRSLEVLALRLQPGGSLTVSLPVTLSDEYVMGGPRRKVIGPPLEAWIEECGLAGYCH